MEKREALNALGMLVDLGDFCGKDDSRGWLRRPFRIGAFVYASDGSIGIRVAATEWDMEHVDELYVEKGRILEEVVTGEVVRSFDLPRDIEAPVEVPCDRCGADGFTNCAHCGSQVDCEACGCTGYRKSDPSIQIADQIRCYRDDLIRVQKAVGLDLKVEVLDKWRPKYPLRLSFSGGLCMVRTLELEKAKVE